MVNMSIGILISLVLTHTIADGDVWVVCHPDSDATILERCDSEHTYMSNGDDGYKLVKGTEESYTVVDTLGDFHGRSWFRLGYLWSC